MDLQLNVNYAAGKSDSREKRVDFVGSYLAFNGANQILSVGQQKRYWGASHEGSLILGHSARPVVGLNLQRDRRTPFESQWLSWLGAWQYQIFAGQMLNHQGMHSPQNSKLIGTRVSIMPQPYLEVGASRVIQWGGKGRPQSLSTFANALLGRDNAGQDEVVSVEKEPGNQIAGIDFKLRLKQWLNLPLAVYGEIVGEDEAGYLPAKKSYLFGIDGSHNISHRQTLNWHLEASDTSTEFGKANVLYQHHIYKDGYTHQKRPLGHSLGGNMRAVILGLNSYYTNNDITALVKSHSWHSKLIYAKTVVSKRSISTENSPAYQGIQLGWQGEMPINRYITAKVGVSGWALKAKSSNNQFGVSLSSALLF